ncbi:MAG TPA: amino acid adenylation domain-containing protein, partial [Longimicrobium sp.]|nr:amino acid adenylation domain-containing protein [Longimicrobium sp.]
MEMVVALLGVLKAGGAYVPLDPEYPRERLAYMLADAAVPVLLTQPHLLETIPEHGAETLAIDPAFAAIAGEPRTAPEDLASPDHLAYAIYTSGSTGNPKGAMNAHRGVVNRLLWMQEEYGLTPDDVVLQKTPFSFDVSVWEFFWPLLAGARLVLAKPGGHRDPAYLAGLIDREGVTTLHFVPSMLAAFLDAAPAGTCGSLVRVVCSGEALPAELAERFHAWMDQGGNGRVGLHNLYGPTEAAVDVTYWPVARADASGQVPIGLPVANTAIHLLDPRGVPVPVGVPGELHIAGAQVGRGYLGRPALTAEKFVPDPFSAVPGARMYRTGDRVRRREDGALLFLGRMDFQVKLRGFRIELGEIESRLLRHPALSAAVAVVREDAAVGPRLVAYVVAREGAAVPAAAELRAHLGQAMPDHMVPGAFVAMEALPLTGSGKVDRRALPAPQGAEHAGEHVAPRTQTEQVLAELWTELLGVERVGVADGFFELGGHSLLATRLGSGVRARLGVEVPVRAVFEHPTLEGFAGEVDRLLRASAGIEAPPIRPAERGGPLPLSFAQERLWFVDRLEPGSAVYHMPFQYLLRGPLDVDALRRAFGEMVRRHEMLRTALPFTGEQPVQVIAPALPVDLPVHDFRHLPEAERDGEEERVLREAATQPFDMAHGPLFRVALVRLGEDEHVLAVVLHHVISDGWSLGVLWTELSALYGAFAEGLPSPLPELPIQYGDFAVWQRGWLSGEVLAAQLGYWRRKLAGIPPLLELPTDRTRPAVQTYAGAVETLVLQGDDAAAVAALGRREGATLFMVLLAAMSVVFARLAGQDDVVIGTPIAGRTRRETEGLIGLFLNSLALRTDLSGEPTFRELLRRVRETTLEAYAHQDLPFERILEELAPERSLSHAPLFQVMLNLQNFDGGEMSLAGLEVHPAGVGGDVVSKFDLTLYAGESPDGLVMHLDYNVALFDADRIRSMLAQVAAVLRQAAEDADRPVHRYSLLTDEARAVLPDPAAPLSAEWRGSVPEIFARHAARTPDAVAVEDPRERWSYAELDAASTSIARQLIADGVRPGEVVAILGHRSAALV